MTPTIQPQRDEILSLIADYCDGTISNADGEQLTTLLRDDSAARSLYIEYLDLHLALRKHAKGQETEAGKTEVASGQWPVVTGESQVTSSLNLPVTPSLHRPVLGFLASISRHVPGGEFTVGSLLLLVIVAAFWGLSQAILYPRLGGHDLAVSSAANEGETVATIRITSDVEWSAHHSALSTSHAEIAAGQPLSIQSGLIELQLTSGTTLVIEGPADWTIDRANNATLTRGKLVANVPAPAVGFTLNTPTAKIVDLGTEFGVEVNTDGKTDVQVLAGKVELISSAVQPASAPRAVTLHAGQAMRISGDQPPISIAPATDRFVSSLEQDQGKARLAAKSAAPDLERYRRPDLAALFVTDAAAKDSQRWTNVATSLGLNVALPAMKDGVIHGPRSTPTPERSASSPHAMALWFDGKDDSVEFEPYDFGKQFTIAAWIYPFNTRMPMSLFSNLTAKGNSSQGFLWQVNEYGPKLPLSEAASGRLVVGVHDGEATGYIAMSQTGKVQFERWQHVAVAVDAVRLEARLYVNGVDVRWGGEQGTLKQLATAGVWRVGGGPHNGYLGMIDELAIYRRILSPQEISELSGPFPK